MNRKKDFRVQCKDCIFCKFRGEWEELRLWGIFKYNHYYCNSFKCNLSEAQRVAWRNCMCYTDW